MTTVCSTCKGSGTHFDIIVLSEDDCPACGGTGEDETVYASDDLVLRILVDQ